VGPEARMEGGIGDDGGSAARRIVLPCLFNRPQLLSFHHRKADSEHPPHVLGFHCAVVVLALFLIMLWRSGWRLYPAAASGASGWLLDNFVSDVLRSPVSSNWSFWFCSRPSVHRSVLESSPLSPLGAVSRDPAAGTARSVPLTHADLREGRPAGSRFLPLSSELRFLRDAVTELRARV